MPPLEPFECRQTILDFLQSIWRRVKLGVVVPQEERQVFEPGFQVITLFGVLREPGIERCEFPHTLEDRRKSAEHRRVAVIQRGICLCRQAAQTVGVAEHGFLGRKAIVLAR